MEAENKDGKIPPGPPSSSVDPLVTRPKFTPPSIDQSQTEGGLAGAAGNESGRESGSDAPDEDISLENLDNLLGAADPAFLAEMNELAVSVMDEDVQIHANELVGTQVSEEDPNFIIDKKTGEKKPRSKISQLLFRLKNVVFRRNTVASSAVQDTLANVQEMRSTSGAILRRYSARDWKIIALFCFTLFVMGFAFKVVQPILDRWLKGDFFGNYDQVADQRVVLPEDAVIRSFKDPLEEFNFIVQYERTIVNLKPSMNSSSNPMTTFVVYVEGTSRETAIELKDRQMEIRDIMQRVAEGLTYDEFVSAEGKRRFKNLVRKDVNEILNEGHLRAIYFDTVIVKP